MSVWASPIRCVECDKRSRFEWDTSKNSFDEPMIKLMREHGQNVYSFVCENCNAQEKA